jgi:XTP/dITP diphosphohydrolase
VGAKPERPLRRVVLASGNAGKLREIQAMLQGTGLEILPQSAFDIEPPVEDGDSFIANALLKARHASRHSGLPAIADDSGLAVDALGGAPGVRSARYAGDDCNDQQNNRRLLEELSRFPGASRAASFHCAAVFVREPQDLQPVICQGRWEGSIAFAPRGSGGFGYDPLFVPRGEQRTAAELPAAEKNRVSHRARAFAALTGALSRLSP